MRDFVKNQEIKEFDDNNRYQKEIDFLNEIIKKGYQKQS